MFNSRVIYLQVSMNNGLSFISSNVHITTTECVSNNFTPFSSFVSLYFFVLPHIFGIFSHFSGDDENRSGFDIKDPLSLEKQLPDGSVPCEN